MECGGLTPLFFGVACHAVLRPVKPGRMKARSSPRTPKSLRDNMWHVREKPGNVREPINLIAPALLVIVPADGVVARNATRPRREQIRAMQSEPDQMEPRVSFVVPTFNSERTLSE